MNNTLLAFAAIAFFSLPTFAVDGVILINQATVESSGGFPYRITQPGSYKLSGNLVAPLDQSAILITASYVTLDLDGFNVTCTFDTHLHNEFINCIGDGGQGLGAPYASVRNGTVTATQTGGTFSAPAPQVDAIGFFYSTALTVEDLRIVVNATAFTTAAIDAPSMSIIRHNVLAGQGGFNMQCPGLIEGNINSGSGGANGSSDCVFVNNVGIF